MKVLTMKVFRRVILVMLVLSVLFVVGDYCGLFLSFHGDGAMLFAFGFKFVDSVDGSVVSGVEVSAEYEGSVVSNRHADQRQDSVIFVISKGFGGTQTILFHKPSKRKARRKFNQREFDFTFQHPLYETDKRTVSIAKDGNSINVKLVPLMNARAE